MQMMLWWSLWWGLAEPALRRNLQWEVDFVLVRVSRCEGVFTCNLCQRNVINVVLSMHSAYVMLQYNALLFRMKKSSFQSNTKSHTLLFHLDLPKLKHLSPYKINPTIL
jgi:hypothetical protein